MSEIDPETLREEGERYKDFENFEGYQTEDGLYLITEDDEVLGAFQLEEESEDQEEVMECIFTDWDCPVKSDEIPLEVCNTCIEARSTSYEKPIKISR